MNTSVVSHYNKNVYARNAELYKLLAHPVRLGVRSKRDNGEAVYSIVNPEIVAPCKILKDLWDKPE